MSKRLGIFNSVNKFLTDSLHQAEYATGAMYVGAAGAAYGAVNGATSDHSTVMGGAVGGALTGAVAGAGIAYGAHKSAAVRNVIDSLGLRIGGVHKEANAIADEYRVMKEAGNVNFTNIGNSIHAGSKSNENIKHGKHAFMESLARRFHDIDEQMGSTTVGAKKGFMDNFNNIKAGYDNYMNPGAASKASDATNP